MMMMMKQEQEQEEAEEEEEQEEEEEAEAEEGEAHVHLRAGRTTNCRLVSAVFGVHSLRARARGLRGLVCPGTAHAAS